MKQKDKEKKGLQNSSRDKPLSEETHAIELLSSVASKYSISDVYEIPHAYNIDKIVIMPVNDETSFIYWELTDRLLKSKLQELNVGFANLIIKIFEIEQDHKKEIYSFKVKEQIGKHYIKYHTSFNPLVADARILKEGEFIVLLKSKTISTSSYEAKEIEDEIWMKKTKDMCEIIRLPGSEITNDITHIAKETKLQKYYKEALELHRNPLSSDLILTLPSSRA